MSLKLQSHSIPELNGISKKSAFGEKECHEFIDLSLQHTTSQFFINVFVTPPKEEWSRLMSNLQVDVLFPGFSGRLNNGRLGWGTTALIRDGRRNVLMDCGGLVVRQTLRSMLDKHGLNFGDIHMVLLSHLHADHVYNVDYFPQAEFVFSLREWDAANDPIHPDYSVGEMAIPLLRSFKKRMVLADDEEVFSGVTTLLTPGHTLGSISYVVHTNNGPWVLTGDAVKNRCELRDEVVQQSMDAAASRDSIRKIKSIAVRVLPGHDGWITVKDDRIIPEGGNDIILEMGEGLLVNGQTRLILKMSWVSKELSV
jgi:glyoxylase-like metal-dependent hydrolase (beta-lactamase superfamily II)